MAYMFTYMEAIFVVIIVRKKSLLMHKLKRFIRIFKREYTVSDMSKLSRIYQHIGSPRMWYLMGICCRVLP